MQRMFVLAFSIAAAAAGGAMAQPLYPDKPIHLLVGFPPGSQADTVARLFGQKLAEAVGRPVVIDTASGAAGSIAADRLAKAAPDGYTLGIATTTTHVTAPIFNRGRLHGNVDVARAQDRIAIADYERTIQGAFQEVSNGLAGRRYLAEQVDAQERGTEAQRQIAALAHTRYLEGVVSYIEVLDAERNLFAAEQALLQLRRVQADNLVALYVALGGGLSDAR